jgi:hypothetical protein
MFLKGCHFESFEDINSNVQTTEITVETCSPVVFTGMPEERNAYTKSGSKYYGAYHLNSRLMTLL